MRTSLRSITALAASLSLVACDSKPAIDRSIDRATEPTVIDAQFIDSTLEIRRTTEAEITEAFAAHAASLQVLVRGTVTKHLADDVDGDKHQRFIVKLESGMTLLVAHNIDLATRVPAASLGKIVYAYGEYEWNDEGGVVHWTHKDPDGVHAPGWIQFEGVLYQ